MASYGEAYMQSLIDEQIGRGQKCRGNFNHEGPFYLAMWRYVAYYTGIYKNFKRVGDRPHYSQAVGLLCEKCISEFGAYRLPDRK